MCSQTVAASISDSGSAEPHAKYRSQANFWVAGTEAFVLVDAMEDLFADTIGNLTLAIRVCITLEKAWGRVC